jgi:methylated-DNA-[protein]-cysteine S-methyltransferase
MLLLLFRYQVIVVSDLKSLHCLSLDPGCLCLRIETAVVRMYQGEEMAGLFYDSVSTPLGQIYISYILAAKEASGVCLTGLVFRRNDLLLQIRGRFGMREAADINSIRKMPLPDHIKREFDEYFEGTRKDFEIPFTLSGTDFEKKVWLMLRKIPYGETRTYKWLAGMVGALSGSRAVGQALSRNPLPIILPCHRVIQSDGKLGGYSSGVEIKRRLLDLEYYNMS